MEEKMYKTRKEAGIVKREEGKDKEGKKNVGNEKTRGPGPSEE